MFNVLSELLVRDALQQKKIEQLYELLSLQTDTIAELHGRIQRLSAVVSTHEKQLQNVQQVTIIVAVGEADEF